MHSWILLWNDPGWLTLSRHMLAKKFYQYSKVFGNWLFHTQLDFTEIPYYTWPIVSFALECNVQRNMLKRFQFVRKVWKLGTFRWGSQFNWDLFCSSLNYKKLGNIINFISYGVTWPYHKKFTFLKLLKRIRFYRLRFHIKHFFKETK